jgi:hypothetical protein
MTALAVRYLTAVQLQPAYVRAGFALLAGLGCWQLHISPDDPTAPLATLLLWQMFAVSTGFWTAARAGHYDALLVAGGARAWVALVHWSLSAGPGAFAWVALTGFAAAAGGGMLPESVRVASLLALLIVSTVGWAGGLFLPRLGAGVVWVTVILLFGTTSAGLIQMRLLAGDGGLHGSGESIVAGLTFVVCPFLLLGSPPAAENVWVRVMALLVSLLALGLGVQCIVRMQFPLKAR